MSRPGARVEHVEHGPCTLVRVVNGGRDWVVRFDGRPHTPYFFPARSFRTSPPAARPRPVAPAPRPAPAPAVRDAPLGVADGRQALEALRLGVVPSRGVSRLTVGRDAELARVRALVHARRGLMVLSGGYGSGKTHLVELVEAEALAAGMLVARASFDPDEIPPSNPLRVYAALASSLRYPQGTVRGLRPLLDRLAGSADHAEPGGAAFHRWLSPATWALGRADGAVADVLIEWLEGAPHDKDELERRLRSAGWRGPSLLTLRDYRTFGQIMGHLLGGVAQWAKDAGWNGLVVCLDEAEYFDHLGATARELAANVLAYLAVGALPDRELPFAPDDLYRGGQPTHRRVTARFAQDQPLAVVCAFTPNPRTDHALRGLVPAAAFVPIEPVGPASFARLADGVLDLVRSAWPALDPPAKDRAWIAHALRDAYDAGTVTSTRQAARLLVEFWDLYRAEPQRALRALGR